MNKGLKVWQEPNGKWTACFFTTKQCRDEDWIPMTECKDDPIDWTDQAIEIQHWLDRNSPSDHGASFSPYQAMVQWNRAGGETAMLFKIAFSNAT